MQENIKDLGKKLGALVSIFSSPLSDSSFLDSSSGACSSSESDSKTLSSSLSLI